MSDPQPDNLVRGIPAYDPGNTLLGIVPAQLTTSVQDTPDGKRLAATVRTPDATLTVFLDADGTDNWIHALTATRKQMSGLALPQTGLIVPGR